MAPPPIAPLPIPDGPCTDGTVLLRRAEERDGAAVLAYGQDPDLEETAWLPIPVPCSHETAARLVEEFRRGWDGRFGLTLIITTPPDVAMRGVLHLSINNEGVGAIAYGIAPASRGRGLATRATMLAAAWAFAHLALARLEILVTAGGDYGPASRRVAEKAGFSYAGTRRSRVEATGLDYEDPLYVLRAPDTARDEAARRV